MAVEAPLRVPVEIRRAERRVFRLADGVSEEGLHFLAALPDDFDGPLVLAFHLPEEREPLSVQAIAVAVDGDRHPGEHDGGRPAPRRAVRFHLLDEVVRARIAAYVAERVPAP